MHAGNDAPAQSVPTAATTQVWPASSTAAPNRCILYSDLTDRQLRPMTDSEKMLLMLISVVAALGLAGLYLLLKVLWRIVAELEKRNRSL